MNRQNNELYHYGIPGMKWGVRRYQNEDGSLTKVGKNRRSKRDKRASKYIDKADHIQKDIDKLQSKNKQSKYIQRKIKKLEQRKEQNLKDAETKKQGKLTRKEKAMIAGAAVVTAYATYKFLDSGHGTQLIAKGKAALGISGLEYKKNYELASKDMDADAIFSKVVSRINPGYGGIGTTNNCRRCTFAYEMSRRGYDVKATKSISGTGQTVVGLSNAVSKGTGFFSYFKEAMTDGSLTSKIVNENRNTGLFTLDKVAKLGNEDMSDSIFRKIGTYPNGARGELAIMWSVGGGHSMAWEVIKGKPVVFDCQTGTQYDAKSLGDAFGKLISEAGLTRLDNIDLNNDFLLRWVQNA